jgi:hypothetical protein
MATRHRDSSEIGAMASRVMRALVRRAADGDTEALEVLAGIHRQSAEAVRDAGHELVTFGYTYAELAQVLGTSRQAAQKRFGTIGLGEVAS